jgi:hypothetical protein
MRKFFDWMIKILPSPTGHIVVTGMNDPAYSVKQIYVNKLKLLYA